jgi:hypothetical protein
VLPCMVEENFTGDFLGIAHTDPKFSHDQRSKPLIILSKS